MVSCARWADSHGHHDYGDRRFYPTPRDIKYALECHSAKQHFDKNDAISVDKLVKTKLKDSILYYQPLSRANNQALIIVYQSMEQRRRAKAYGQDIVFVDATYSGVTAYGFAFYCLLVRDTFGHGTPIAFFVISQENEKNIHTCFEKFKITNPEVSPRAFMVDKDYKEIHVISSLYPMSDVLLCWFHVLQAVQRWLTKSESDISGLANQDKRKAVIKYMSAMKQCTTEEAFQEMVDEMESEIPFQKCVEYLRRNWVPIGHMWAAFGRRFYHGNSETNNLIERFFLGIKYQFLHGYANRRLDDLLTLLDSDVIEYYNYMENLKEANRLTNNSAKRKNLVLKKTEELVKKGWLNKIKWRSEVECEVPSEGNPDSQYYEVDLIRATCTCYNASIGGMCKHVNLALTAAVSKGVDINAKRQEVAEHLFENKEFELESHFLDLFYKDCCTSVNLTLSTCTCIAFSHGLDCVCLKLCNIVNTSSGTKDTVQRHCQDNDLEFKKKGKDNILVEDDVSQMILDLYMLSETGALPNNASFNEHISAAHMLAFSTFQKVSSNRKIHVLHPYRKSILAAKRVHIEHDYQIKQGNRSSKRTTQPDMAFHPKIGSMTMSKKKRLKLST